MDTVTILRQLWRRRFLVLGVYVVALLAGTTVLYKVSPPFKFESRKYHVGVATTSILIDTPSSQVVEIAPKGSDTLGVRANLIASLMVDGVVKADIARAAGLSPGDLVATSTSVDNQVMVQPADKNAPLLTTRVVTDNDGDNLPIVQVEAQAGDAAGASRLAGAAVQGLRNYLDTKAAAQRVPGAQRLQITALGEAQTRTEARGPKSIFAVLAFLVVFCLGCGAILGLTALVRGWRAAAAAEDGTPAQAAPAVVAAPRPAPAAAEPVPAAQAAPEPGGADSWLSAPVRPLPVSRPHPHSDQQRRARSA